MAELGEGERQPRGQAGGRGEKEIEEEKREKGKKKGTPYGQVEEKKKER